MNKVIFAIFGIALFMLPTNGETTQKRKPLSMAERVALQKRIALKRTGGIVRKENSAKGSQRKYLHPQVDFQSIQVLLR